MRRAADALTGTVILPTTTGCEAEPVKTNGTVYVEYSYHNDYNAQTEKWVELTIFVYIRIFGYTDHSITKYRSIFHNMYYKMMSDLRRCDAGAKI